MNELIRCTIEVPLALFPCSIVIDPEGKIWSNTISACDKGYATMSFSLFIPKDTYCEVYKTSKMLLAALDDVLSFEFSKESATLFFQNGTTIEMADCPDDLLRTHLPDSWIGVVDGDNCIIIFTVANYLNPYIVN